MEREKGGGSLGGKCREEQREPCREGNAVLGAFSNIYHRGPIVAA